MRLRAKVAMARFAAWQLQLLVLALIWCSYISSVVSQSEVQILINFKNTVDDPNGALKSWNAADALPCQWEGITCDSSNRVTEINLENTNISGPVPDNLCQLQDLKKLILSLNFFNESFPSGLLTCGVLEHLDLSYNLIVGPLPLNISKLQSLTFLDLSYNNFTGPVPPSFGSLPALQSLNLTANLLTGTLPTEIGSLSALTELALQANYDLGGQLPDELGNLTRLEIMNFASCAFYGPIPVSLGRLVNLTHLLLGGNNLTGPIPTTISQLQQLVLLDLSKNSLSGVIPSEITSLPQLTTLFLWNNQLVGEIPTEIGNLSSLVQFDVTQNNLNGSLPDGLSQIQSLEVIHASENFLSGTIPVGFGGLKNLQNLRLFQNSLTGPIPATLGNSFALEVLDLSSNYLTGQLPPNLCAGGNLSDLILLQNQLSGPIPEGLGNCPSLIRVRIEYNAFTGIIPVGMWGYRDLQYLSLSYNRFEGSIGSNIGEAVSLGALLLDSNLFTGVIPSEIGLAQNLSEFQASQNRLGGPLPVELGQLERLSKLELGVNFFTGQIPSLIENCQLLAILNLSSNQFNGSIPPQLGSLQALDNLDLSYNQLSGPLPPELGDLKLTEYNFSYNDLSGKLPAPFNMTLVPSSFLGNPGLEVCTSSESNCSISQDGDSSNRAPKSGHSSSLAWAVGATFAAAALIFIMGACILWRRFSIQILYWRNRRKDRDLTWSLRSFQKVNFFQEEVMGCLDEDSVIGSGASGKVYKAELSNGQIVAVKKLEARNDNGFSAEVETLGKIRHRNIVKLLCCCSNNESNLLVYEYMPNGSLGDYLHSPKAVSVLDWNTRFKIAIGAAEGLAYLHHDCAPPIVHRDVKSNNILLDNDLEAHLGDFGLAKVFEADSMSAVAGSYGYIAPEYAYTLKVTEKSDIYSFGVVLLELVSGRRPIEAEFGEMDIVKWVTKKIETKAGALEVLDSKIRASAQEDMMLVLKVGLLCTSFLPSNRPNMREVVQMLLEACPREQALKERSLSTKDGREGKESIVTIDPSVFTSLEKV